MNQVNAMAVVMLAPCKHLVSMADALEKARYAAKNDRDEFAAFNEKRTQTQAAAFHSGALAVKKDRPDEIEAWRARAVETENNLDRTRINAASRTSACPERNSAFAGLCKALNGLRGITMAREEN